MPKILIVDDEVVNLELAEALLAQDGYEVHLAQDGTEALQKVQDARPDIVLMDIVMPKMNGIETCRKIKTNPLSYATPVVMVTALNSTEDKVKAIQAGADDFISKPFDRLELSARVKSLLRLKAIHDRLETSMTTLKDMQRAREELMARAAKDFESPMTLIAECLKAVSVEASHLSPETAQKLEAALYCIEMATTMATDFVNIMKMEQDKLKQAYEFLKTEEHQPTASGDGNKEMALL
jgi:DNA-binding response OmpR family regulator